MAKKPVRGPHNPYQTSDGSTELSPANQRAFDLVAARRDLLPSIEQIMNAGLSDEQAAAALDLFQAALTSPGDPHRDPRAAVAAVGGAAG